LRAIVTGGAGFIGSHLVEFLVDKGYEVLVIDNLSSGRYEIIKPLIDRNKINFIKADLKKFNKEWTRLFKDIDVVYHLAANPEVRVSVTEPRIHFDENVLATFNVLEACRLNNVRFLVFASSSTVYGDADKFPTPESYQPLEPISVYGAAKLASENLIITYSKLYGIKSLILRFANIVGPRQTHGVIIDFIKKLRNNPFELEILGDGTQKKSYLYIYDLITAMHSAIHYMETMGSLYEVFNVGNEDWVTVKEIADIVVNVMGLKDVRYIFSPATKDGRGWIGDVKFMLLDITKIKSTGWKPSMNSAEAIRKTAEYLITNL
jgi:UDP-glucose 4-epimerase